MVTEYKGPVEYTGEILPLDDTSPVTSPRLSTKKKLPAQGEMTIAERMASEPLTRFALGAASPAFLAARAFGSGKPEVMELVKRGREARGSTGIDIPLMAGEAMNPAALTVGKVAPYAKIFGEGGKGIQAFGQNITAGAGMGITTGGTAEKPETFERAAIGAGANVMIPPVLNAAVKSAGWIWDNLVGRWGAIKASQIVKDAAGGDILAIKAATKAGAPSETATQATAGVKNDVWDALGEMAKRQDKTSGYSRLAALQHQGRTEPLIRMAGGPTQTEARQSREAAQAGLNRITSPMRETELGAANIAGQIGPRLQGEAASIAEAASSKAEDVRRLSQAGQIAEELGQSGRMRLDAGAPPISGLPRLAGRYSYGHELSDLAERLAQSSANDSVLLGQAARFKQMQVQSLSEHGLRPLDSGFITRALNAKIADPRIGSEIMKEKVLTTVRDRISEWTNAGGVIDAHALYGIRKSAVNDTIEQLMGASDPKAKAQAAAGVLKEIKPLIDDAIIKAGGTKWTDYLKTFESGMRQVQQQKMAAKGLDLLQTSPVKFESLAGGNEPKMVEKVFKTEYDIQAAMGQNKFQIFRKIADELSRDRSIVEGAARGEGGLARVLDRDTLRLRLPALFTREATVANKALDIFEKNLSSKTMDAIVEGMRTGKNANELLNMMSSAEKIKVLKGLGSIAVTATASSVP